MTPETRKHLINVIENTLASVKTTRTDLIDASAGMGLFTEIRYSNAVLHLDICTDALESELSSLRRAEKEGQS